MPDKHKGTIFDFTYFGQFFKEAHNTQENKRMNRILARWCANLVGLSLLGLVACSNDVKQDRALVPERASSEELAKDYRKALLQWKKNRPQHYSLRFHYGAFSPFSGNWEIEIKDGKVIRRLHDGVLLTADRPAMNGMCMERLFDLAAPATNAVHDGPMRIFARLSKHGWVASVRRTKNPNWNRPIPKDLTWFYEVTSLTIH